ncbi:unnamed protein product [Auanema sp. JU1783]|nr:unnamed protein product [Auanema sp. JU1783]
MMFFFLSLVTFFSYCAATDQLSCNPRYGGTPVPIGVFIAKSHLVTKLSDIEIPMRISLHYIQNHSCILDGFKLELITKDTGCATSLGMRALFELIAARPRPVAIFGGMCTEVNEPVAMALKYWQIVQLSYAETHPKFASADSLELYPTFFRIIPGDRNINNAKCQLINYFKWKKVGTIKQSDEARHALPHETLTTKLEHGYGIRIAYTAGVTLREQDNIGYELDNLKAKDVRVIIMDVEEKMISLIFCEAYKRHMYGDYYVWIIPGYHANIWERSKFGNCSKEQVELVFRNHFAVQHALSRNDFDKVIVGGKKAGDIWGELEKSSSLLRGYLYDGLWALSIALSKALGKDASFSHSKLLTAIYNTSFEGITGKVQFENNERLGLVDILQWRSDKYYYIGRYDGAENTFQINETNLGDWNAPLDSTIIEIRKEYITYSLFSAMAFASLIGISLAILFLFLNVKYRKHRFIKMSSPNLNNIIIIGSIFTFASVILLGLDTRVLSSEEFVKMCYAKSWTLSLGFTLAFGAMFSKTWRVHSIFTNIRMDRKAIKDSKLFMILGFLLLVDIIVLSSWAIFSPFHITAMELPKIQMDYNVIVPIVERCQSEHSMVFQATLYVSKGVLMVLGCFLAWETRHVNVPALNDSKYIGMSVYGVVVTSILGLSISVILQERVNEAFALTSFLIMFSTAVTLCLVFVPKAVELIRNPQGTEPRTYRRGMMKSVVAKPAPCQPVITNITKNIREVDKDLLSKVESENIIRRRYLHQKSSQLWDLLAHLRELGDTHFLQQEWCYISNNVNTDTENDRLLCQHSVQWEAGKLNAEHSEGWPWVDPDEPSTLL